MGQLTWILAVFVTTALLIEDAKCYDFPPNFCWIPGDRTDSRAVFLEDCPNLSDFKYLPRPVHYSQVLGVHPKVCCPRVVEANLLEGDEEYEYDEEEEDAYVEEEGNDGEGYEVGPSIKVSDQKCHGIKLEDFGDLSECVTIDRCPELLESGVAPQHSVDLCGFDKQSAKMMMCCPKKFVITSPKTQAKAVSAQAPRFPDASGSPRPVEDRTPLCSRWKEHGGCDLDRDFAFNGTNAGHTDDFGSDTVTSWTMFSFMQQACMGSCGWTNNKGCVDEHPRCEDWASQGQCIRNPKFMTHTCRESCGVCGFLSPTNKEDQVVGEKSYTDIKKAEFECGRYKRLCDIEKDTTCTDSKTAAEISNKIHKSRSKRQAKEEKEENGEFSIFSYNKGSVSQGGYFCGATIISDRFFLAAAHCYDDFEENNQVLVNTVRDLTRYKSRVEIKKVYRHPLYKAPSLYNDLAVGEFGRRLEYDFDKFGDSPTCLNTKDRDIEGEIATVQGYGEDENGVSGNLMETNVTVISNNECKTILASNSSLDNSGTMKENLDKALANGINYGLLCSQGIYNTDANIFSGPCAGDDGGPLTVEEEGVKRLVGVVSGGIGCGTGVPSWYTKVSFFRPWIDCVISAALETGGVRAQVEERCSKVAESLVPDCLDTKDLMFDLDSLNTIDDSFSIPRCDQ